MALFYHGPRGPPSGTGQLNPLASPQTVKLAVRIDCQSRVRKAAVHPHPAQQLFPPPSSTIFIFPFLLLQHFLDSNLIYPAPHLASTMAGIFLRNRGIFAVSFVAAAVTTAAFKYKSDAYRSNELAQQQRKAPNGYVSVDRSGGGI